MLPNQRCTVIAFLISLWCQTSLVICDRNPSQIFPFCEDYHFIFSSFIETWKITLCKFRYMLWQFYIHLYCEMITVIRLFNTAITSKTTSHVCVCVSRTSKIYSFNKFHVYNTVYLCSLCCIELLLSCCMLDLQNLLIFNGKFVPFTHQLPFPSPTFSPW